MQQVPIQAIPNQSFSTTLDGNNWEISIKTTNGTVSVSLVKNNVPLVTNARAVANARIIPAEYQESGNFVIACANQQLPNYEEFGNTQILLYGSQAGIDAVRVTPQDLITAAFFDPIAPLPLRFAPQGYTLAP